MATTEQYNLKLRAFAQLTADSRRTGHGLQDGKHTADRWIATTAIAQDLPPLSREGISRDAPGLRLLGEEGV